MPPRAHFTLAFRMPAPRRCEEEPRLARHGHGIENESMRFERGRGRGIEHVQPTELRRREGGMPLRAHVTLASMVPAPRRCQGDSRLARHGHGIEKESFI